MEPKQPPELSHQELRNELDAALKARQELGPEMDDAMLDHFLMRLEQRVDARVQQQVAAQGKSGKAAKAAKSAKHNPAAVGFLVAVPRGGARACRGVGLGLLAAEVAVLDVVRGVVPVDTA